MNDKLTLNPDIKRLKENSQFKLDSLTNADFSFCVKEANKIREELKYIYHIELDNESFEKILFSLNLLKKEIPNGLIAKRKFERYKRFLITKEEIKGKKRLGDISPKVLEFYNKEIPKDEHILFYEGLLNSDYSKITGISKLKEKVSMLEMIVATSNLQDCNIKINAPTKLRLEPITIDSKNDIGQILENILFQVKLQYENIKKFMGEEIPLARFANILHEYITNDIKMLHNKDKLVKIPNSSMFQMIAYLLSHFGLFDTKEEDKLINYNSKANFLSKQAKSVKNIVIFGYLKK